MSVLLSIVVASGCAQKERPPNIVLISIDTCRSDHLSCYGYERATSPTIDSLAASGVLFENVTAASPWTLPSHATLFSSTHPLTHGVVDDGCGIPSGLPMLAEILQAEGYHCGGVVSCTYVGPTFGFDRGFDYFEDFQADMFKQIEPEYKIQARAVTDSGLQWLEGVEEPFFLFLHYFDAHVKYAVPDPYRRLFTGNELIHDWLYAGPRHYEKHPVKPSHKFHILAHYDAAIAYVDANIRRVLDTLGARDLADRTVIAVTADHGEEFFERGRWRHAHTLYRELTAVPLVISDPRGAHRGVRVPEPVRLLDVMPTLLASAGLPPPTGAQGEDLWPLVSENTDAWDPLIFTDTSRYSTNLISLASGGRKLIMNLNDGTRELYDLRSDPLESDNVETTEAPLVDALTGDLLNMAGELIPWRLCVRWIPGDEGHVYSGEIGNLHVVLAGIETAGDRACRLRVPDDRRRLMFESVHPGEIRLAMIPPDGSLDVDLRIGGEPAFDHVFVGGDAVEPSQLPLSLDFPIESPALFDAPPETGPGFYVWIDRGDRTPAEPVELSVELKDHLRSLGYLH